MELDAVGSIGELSNCSQREMTETSMPDKDVFLINLLADARVYLSILNLIQCIENDRS
jgi:hypothetical protein